MSQTNRDLFKGLKQRINIAHYIGANQAAQLEAACDNENVGAAKVAPKPAPKKIKKVD
jgi:hypothetical protein